ncbi:MAG: hypothetical protein Q8R16_05355 [bacterium]|nr:hypothetical protein [bacterium]
MPTLQEIFRDQAALDLALHEIISACPTELRLAMVTDPQGPREIAAFQRTRDRFPEIGNLPTILFRAGLAAGIIACELHALLEDGGDNARLRFSDDLIVVDGPGGPTIPAVVTITRRIANDLVISEVSAAYLWQSFVHLMREHYRRPTFFHLRVERGGTMRLLRPAHAATQPTNA